MILLFLHQPELVCNDFYICEDYDREYEFIFNAVKSKTIIFGPDFGKLNLSLNRKLTLVVDKIKHLGHLISNKEIHFYYQRSKGEIQFNFLYI